jgi:hypothetical protein
MATAATNATNFENIAGPISGLNTQVRNPQSTLTNDQLNTAADELTTDTTAAGYNAATVGNTNTYAAQNQAATDYAAASRTADKWTLDPAKETVQSQAAGIIAANSPLMQQAQANALQQMNKRGLVNSSMAIGAGQAAVMDKVLPIAAADAAAYGAANRFNAEQSNIAGAGNQVATNEQKKFGATASNVAAAANQAAINRAAEVNAAAKNVTEQGNIAATNRAAEFTAGAKNQAAAATAADINKTTNLMLDESMKIALSNADSNTKIGLQNIDAQTRKDITNIEAFYKEQMQATQSANELFQQTTSNITKIMENADLTVAAKQAAVDIQKGYLKNAIDILSSISKIPNLTQLINFDAVVK